MVGLKASIKIEKLNKRSLPHIFFSLFRFYVELFIRTFSVTSFTHLITDPNFTLDIISILPSILSQIFYQLYTLENKQENLLTLKQIQVFNYLICLKLFRLFRISRHAKCLQIFFKILYINLKHIIILTILIIFGIFYFGLTQFTLEQMHRNNEMKNIGEALWHVNIKSIILF